LPVSCPRDDGDPPSPKIRFCHVFAAPAVRLFHTPLVYFFAARAMRHVRILPLIAQEPGVKAVRLHLEGSIELVVVVILRSSCRTGPTAPMAIASTNIMAGMPSYWGMI
jgi:hypothetical protein